MNQRQQAIADAVFEQVMICEYDRTTTTVASLMRCATAIPKDATRAEIIAAVEADERMDMEPGDKIAFFGGSYEACAALRIFAVWAMYNTLKDEIEKATKNPRDIRDLTTMRDVEKLLDRAWDLLNANNSRNAKGAA